MNLQQKMKMKTTQLLQLPFLVSNSMTSQYTDLSSFFHSFLTFTLCSLSVLISVLFYSMLLKPQSSMLSSDSTKIYAYVHFVWLRLMCECVFNC